MCTVNIWNQNKTSGIMVVARNQEAASYLCRAWREREMVQKTYLAHVKDWPPYHQHRVSEGTIDVPLAPSRTERIKWEVIPVSEGGKECKTYWKVYQDFDKEGIILELHPITGRTHQLRLHCAEIGSGIVGDSLYGDSPIAWCVDDGQGIGGKSSLGNESPKTLRLHAHKLTFPRPKTGEKVTFESLPLRSWYSIDFCRSNDALT
jgi:23S rRNA-/tRNA-specific pseudouridylate synthase